MKIELGPGKKPHRGYIGVDIDPKSPKIRKCDFEREPLPFDDDSVDAIFSSHCLEHLADPRNVLNEIARVCKQDAEVEIWTPWGWSNDALCIGHRVFYTDLQVSHWTIEFADDWFDGSARLLWRKVRFNLCPGVDEIMKRLDIPLGIALRHLNNVAWEFGCFFTVDKTGAKPTKPVIEMGFGR